QPYTDGTRRPLRPEQLAYAGDDVLHLLPLHDALRAELERRQRAAWVEEELRGLEDPARFADMPPEECYTTVKGWQRLGGREAAILRALAAWRDRSARRANVRPNFIANDVVLTSPAMRPAENAGGLRQTRGLTGGTFERPARAIRPPLPVRAGFPDDGLP